MKYFSSVVLSRETPKGPIRYWVFQNRESDPSEFSFLLLLEMSIQVRSGRRLEDHEVDRGKPFSTSKTSEQ